MRISTTARCTLHHATCRRKAMNLAAAATDGAYGDSYDAGIQLDRQPTMETHRDFKTLAHDLSRPRHPGRHRPDAHRSVVHMLEEAMTSYADMPAFRSFGQTLSYADVDRRQRRVRSLAAAPSSASARATASPS